jgi:hypothetical protein
MEGNIVRRAGAYALVVVCTAATLLVGVGPAAAAKRQAAGTYTATFPSTSTSSTLVITNASGSTTSGNFVFSAFGDYGTWVAQGTTLALSVSTSSAGHAGAVLIAKVTASGIGSGQMGMPGAGEHPWSATRVSGAPAARANAGVRPATRLANPTPGTYTAAFNGEFSDTLTMSKDAAAKTEGTFTLSSLGDSGTWAKLGKKIALGVMNGPDAGTLLVGTQSATAIGTSTAPGVYYDPGNGVHSWYATKH